MCMIKGVTEGPLFPESAKHLERMASRLTKQGKFPNTAEHPECGQALEHKVGCYSICGQIVKSTL